MLNCFNFPQFVRKLIINNVLQGNHRIISSRRKCNLILHRVALYNELQVFQKTDHFFHRNQIPSTCCHSSTDFHSSSLKYQENKEIGEILSSLENKLHHLGVINVNDIHEIIKKLQLSVNSILENDLLKISNLIIEAVKINKFENPDIVEQFGELLLSLKGIKSVEELLCNYLNICLKTKSSLSYKNILTFLENNSHPWTEKICDLLVSCLCHQNMIEEVNDVLRKMESSHIKLNENIYSFLILFYGKKRDLEKIHDIINSMLENQIQPSSSSQSSLVIAYNICEDYEKARSILEEFINFEKKLEAEQYSGILISAIESSCYDKNFDYLSYILDSKSKLVKDSVDLKEVVNYLLTSNYLKEASFVLSKEKSEESLSSFYRTPSADFIEKVINMKQIDHSAVVTFCYELIQNKVNEYAFEIALEKALAAKNNSLSFELMKHLMSKFQPREHLFWPLLASSDLEKTLEIIDKMNGFRTSIGLDTLMQYVIPKLPLESPKLSLQIISKHGISKSKMFGPLISTLISNGQFDEAYDLLSDHSIPFEINHLILRALAISYINNQRASTEMFLTLCSHKYHNTRLDKQILIKKFSSYVQKMSRGKIKGFDVLFAFKEREADHFFSYLHREKPRKISSLNDSHQLLKSYDDSSKDSHQFDVDSELLGTHVQSSVSQFEPVINNLEKDNANRSTAVASAEHSIIESMSVEELEGHLLELKYKGMNTRGVLRKLLLKHSTNGNQERVKEISKELNSLGSHSSPGMLSTILYNKVLEGNAEEALNMFNTLFKSNPDFKIDSYKVVELCSLCARIGKFQESLEVMRKYVNVTPKTFHRRKSILHNCHQLLTDCANVGGYACAREMCSILLSGGLIEPSAVIFGPLIKSKLLSKDLAGAVEEAEELFNVHNVLSLRVELLTEILKWTDDDNETESLVNRVVNLVMLSRGRRQAKKDLLAAALQSHNIEIADKIFKNVEEDLDIDEVKRLCEYFVNREDIDTLQILLNVSKGSSNIDRMHIFECLLNVYFVNRNSKDALNLLMKMQEESINPSSSFSTKLGMLLKSTGTSSTVAGTVL